MATPVTYHQLKVAFDQDALFLKVSEQYVAQYGEEKIHQLYLVVAQHFKGMQEHRGEIVSEQDIAAYKLAARKMDYFNQRYTQVSQVAQAALSPPPPQKPMARKEPVQQPPVQRQPVQRPLPPPAIPTHPVVNKPPVQQQPVQRPLPLPATPKPPTMVDKPPVQQPPPPSFSSAEDLAKYRTLETRFEEDCFFLKACERQDMQALFTAQRIEGLYQEVRKTWSEMEEIAGRQKSLLQETQPMHTQRMHYFNQHPAFAHLQKKVSQDGQAKIPAPKVEAAPQKLSPPSQPPISYAPPPSPPVRVLPTPASQPFYPAPLLQQAPIVGTGIANSGNDCFFSAGMQFFAHTPALLATLTDAHPIKTHFIPQYRDAAARGQPFQGIDDYRSHLLPKNFAEQCQDAHEALSTLIDDRPAINRFAGMINGEAPIVHTPIIHTIREYGPLTPQEHAMLLQLKEHGDPSVEGFPITQQPLQRVFMQPLELVRCTPDEKAQGKSDLEKGLDATFERSLFAEPPTDFLFHLGKNPDHDPGRRFNLKSARFPGQPFPLELPRKEADALHKLLHTRSTLEEVLNRQPRKLKIHYYEVKNDVELISIVSPDPKENLYLRIGKPPFWSSAAGRVLTTLTEKEFLRQQKGRKDPIECTITPDQTQVNYAAQRRGRLSIPLQFTMKGSYVADGKQAEDAPFEITRFIASPPGHYYTYVKEANGSWTRYNDRFVTPNISLREVQEELDLQGYVIYAQRVGPAPHARLPRREEDEAKFPGEGAPYPPPSAPPQEALEEDDPEYRAAIAASLSEGY